MFRKNMLIGVVFVAGSLIEAFSMNVNINIGMKAHLSSLPKIGDLSLLHESSENPRKKNLLMYLIEIGQYEAAEFLIESGVNLNIQDIDGRTALMHAAMCFSNDAARCLIENGAGVNIVSKGGGTALIYAAQKDYAAVAMYLIQKGARLDVRNRDGYTALMFAALCGNLDVVRSILWKDGSSIDDEFLPNKLTALMFAIKKGHNSVAMTLIDRGASLTMANIQGHSALMLAAICGNTEIVDFIMKRNRNLANQVDKNGHTALVHATYKKHDDIKKILLAYAAK